MANRPKDFTLPVLTKPYVQNFPPLRMSPFIEFARKQGYIVTNPLLPIDNCQNKNVCQQQVVENKVVIPLPVNVPKVATPKVLIPSPVNVPKVASPKVLIPSPGNSSKESTPKVLISSGSSESIPSVGSVPSPVLGHLPSNIFIASKPSPVHVRHDDGVHPRIINSPEKIFDIDLLDKKLLKLLETDSGTSEYDFSVVKHKIEKILLENQGKCSPKYLDALRARYFQFLPTYFSKFSKSIGKFDSNFQDDTACLIDAMTTTANKMSDIFPDLRLRSFINKTKVIGAESRYGIATLVSFYEEPLFVVKTPRTHDDEDLNHEAFVGMAAINKLRNKIPNFVHTYGLYKCAPILVNQNKEVVEYCPSPEPTYPYLVIENIDNAKGMRDVAPYLSCQEFLEVYIQIINAINVANKEFDFSHYDLHQDNVLIQQFKDPVTVPIYLSDRIIYLHTRHLARIIDLGRAHVKIGKYHFGEPGYHHVNAYYDRSFPIYDTYKILLASYKPREDQEYERLMDKLYQFYKEDKSITQRMAEYEMRLMQSRLNGLPPADYFQPPNSMINLKLDDLLNYTLDVVLNNKWSFNFENLNYSKGPIMTVCGDSCMTWDQYTNNIFMKNAKPSSIEEYSLALSTLGKMNNVEEYKRFMTSFNLDEAFAKESVNVKRDILNHINYINRVYLPIIDDPVFTIDNYSKGALAVVSFISFYNMTRAWMMQLIYAYNANSRLAVIKSYVFEITKLIDNMKEIIRNYQKIVRTNIDTRPREIVLTPEILHAQQIILYAYTDN